MIFRHELIMKLMLFPVGTENEETESLGEESSSVRTAREAKTGKSKKSGKNKESKMRGMMMKKKGTRKQKEMKKKARKQRGMKKRTRKQEGTKKGTRKHKTRKQNGMKKGTRKEKGMKEGKSKSLNGQKKMKKRINKSKGKKSERQVGKKGGSKRRKAGKEKSQESSVDDGSIQQCLKAAVQYMQQMGKIVTNFHRQRKRAEKHLNLMASKNGKTEDFLAVSELLLEAGGGNLSQLSCSENSTESAILTSLTKDLMDCPSLVNESCGAHTVTPLNQTLVDMCIDLTESFSQAVKECSEVTKRSDSAAACECWTTPELAEMSGMLRDCGNIKDSQTLITDQKTSCVETFQACRGAQDSSAAVLAGCAPSKTDLLEEVEREELNGH